MQWYKHHIGDYAGSTAHLTWDEDMVYTRLIRAYYRTEAPIPLDSAAIFRLIRAGTAGQRKATNQVLSEFFTKSDEGWRNKRCDEEIAAYQAQCKVNQEVGKLGGRPRKTESKPNRLFTETESKPNRNPNQEPRTENQEPEESKSKSMRASRSPDGVKMLTDIGVEEQVAKDWLAVRKAKRAPLTPTVLKFLQAEALKAGISVGDAVAVCARRSWQGFNASWDWQGEGSGELAKPIPTCTRCGKEITGGYTNTDEGKIHPDCYLNRREA